MRCNIVTRAGWCWSSSDLIVPRDWMVMSDLYVSWDVIARILNAIECLLDLCWTCYDGKWGSQEATHLRMLLLADIWMTRSRKLHLLTRSECYLHKLLVKHQIWVPNNFFNRISLAIQSSESIQLMIHSFRKKTYFNSIYDSKHISGLYRLHLRYRAKNIDMLLYLFIIKIWGVSKPAFF